MAVLHDALAVDFNLVVHGEVGVSAEQFVAPFILVEQLEQLRQA